MVRWVLSWFWSQVNISSRFQLYRLTFWTRYSKKERLPLIPQDDDATEMSVITPTASSRASIAEDADWLSNGEVKDYGARGTSNGETSLSRRSTPKAGTPEQATTPRSTSPVEGGPVADTNEAAEGEGDTVIDEGRYI